MKDFVLGIAVTALFFGLIHLSGKVQIEKKEDLDDEESRWLRGE